MRTAVVGHSVPQHRLYLGLNLAILWPRQKGMNTGLGHTSPGHIISRDQWHYSKGIWHPFRPEYKSRFLHLTKI